MMMMRFSSYTWSRCVVRHIHMHLLEIRIKHIQVHHTKLDNAVSWHSDDDGNDDDDDDDVCVKMTIEYSDLYEPLKVMVHELSAYARRFDNRYDKQRRHVAMLYS